SRARGESAPQKHQPGELQLLLQPKIQAWPQLPTVPGAVLAAPPAGQATSRDMEMTWMWMWMCLCLSPSFEILSRAFPGHLGQTGTPISALGSPCPSTNPHWLHQPPPPSRKTGISV
ncbi:hypothetical protein Nmel_017694, partial [Mimus melanotis]